MKSKSLHGGGRRLSVRAVKGAGVWRSLEQRKPLTEGADRSGAGFSQEGMVEPDFFDSWVVTACARSMSKSNPVYTSQYGII